MEQLTCPQCFAEDITMRTGQEYLCHICKTQMLKLTKFEVFLLKRIAELERKLLEPKNN
jgi:hypothetical protein